MSYTVSTTGNSATVIFNDLPDVSGPLTLTHPVVDLDLLDNYDVENLRKSADLQTAISDGDVELRLNGLNVQNVNQLGLGTGDGAGKTFSINAVFDAGTYDIEIGDTINVSVPVSGTISSVRLISKQTGSLILDVKKANFAAFPTFSSIVGTNPPTLISANKYEDTSLSSWSPNIDAGDILEFEIVSNSGIKQLEVYLTVAQ